MTTTITIAEPTIAAISLVAVDPLDWINNAISERARVAVSALKVQPEWVTAAIAVAQAGGNPDDDDAVVARGLADGLFKTAAQIEAEWVTEGPGAD